MCWRRSRSSPSMPSTGEHFVAAAAAGAAMATRQQPHTQLHSCHGCRRSVEATANMKLAAISSDAPDSALEESFGRQLEQVRHQTDAPAAAVAPILSVGHRCNAAMFAGRDRLALPVTPSALRLYTTAGDQAGKGRAGADPEDERVGPLGRAPRLYRGIDRGEGCRGQGFWWDGCTGTAAAAATATAK